MSPFRSIIEVVKIKEHIRTVISAVMLATMATTAMEFAGWGFVTPQARWHKVDTRIDSVQARIDGLARRADSANIKIIAMLNVLTIERCLDVNRTPNDFSRMGLNCKVILGR